MPEERTEKTIVRGRDVFGTLPNIFVKIVDDFKPLQPSVAFYTP